MEGQENVNTGMKIENIKNTKENPKMKLEDKIGLLQQQIRYYIGILLSPSGSEWNCYNKFLSSDGYGAYFSLSETLHRPVHLPQVFCICKVFSSE